MDYRMQGTSNNMVQYAELKLIILTDLVWQTCLKGLSKLTHIPHAAATLES